MSDWLLIILIALLYEAYALTGRAPTLTSMVRRTLLRGPKGSAVIGGLLGWLIWHWGFDHGGLDGWDLGAVGAGALVGLLGFIVRRQRDESNLV
jgi:hypothetical protein